MNVNMKYARPTPDGAGLQYAPKVLNGPGGLILSPGHADYVRFGWYLVVVSLPNPPAGKRLKSRRWVVDGETVVCMYEYEDIPVPVVTVKVFEDAVQGLLNSAVRSKGYDDVYTCISYYNSEDDVFRAEARAVSEWRDRVWRKCHEILNQWNAGEIGQPTVAQVLSQLPKLEWPK